LKIEKIRHTILNQENKISINAEMWGFLTKSYTKEDIKNMIADIILEFEVPMPMREITEEDAYEDFQDLKKVTCSDVIQYSEWFTRYEYQYPLNPILISSNNKGNKSSDFFHQDVRWRCDSINSPSPFRTWTQKRFLLTLLSALWSLKFTHVDENVLRSCIAMRKYIASQFRPSAAKAIIEYFGAKKILDFSSGWGDRLSGFLASDALCYTGVDPNQKLVERYKQQIETFNSENKVCTMIQGCAEDQKYDTTYDLVFTSPPYYNIERYTKNENQSYKKFKKIDQWLDGFLFKALGHAWEALEYEGYMAINISDVYSNHTVNKICDPMNDFIRSLPDAKYAGCLGYQLAKRPNSGALKGKKGRFAEPVWIWQKTKKDASLPEIPSPPSIFDIFSE
jgi:hypothetical protein